MWRRWWLLVLLVLVASACTDGDSDGDEGRAPLPAAAQAEVWAGDRLVVVGADGAAERGPDDSSWRRLPEPPFKNLAAYGAVWTGSELVVVGFQCDDRLDDSASTICSPGHLVGFRFDAKRKWHTIERSEKAPFAADEGREVSMRIGGWTGSEAVLFADGHPVALQPTAEQWRSLPEPPAIPPSLLCVSRRGIVLAHAASRGDGSTAPAEASRLNDGTWTTPSPTPLTLPLYAAGGCVGGDAVILNSTVTEGGYRLNVGDAAIYDTDGTWRSLPAPPFPIQGAGPTVSDGDRRLVVRDDTGHLYVLDTVSGTWTALRGTVDQYERVVALTDEGVVTARQDKTLRRIPVSSRTSG